MCGICGLLTYGPADGRTVEAAIRRMVASLRYRGPDDEGVYLTAVPSAAAPRGWVGLGHTRLSIVDLSPAGRQPMTNEDGSLWLTFNGEIYNFRELRAELATLGHRFRSDTDSEVLLHLYEEEGDGFLRRCNGMFALALWDGRRQRLLLARDRLGVKPLVYAVLPRGIAFASDVRALLHVPGLGRAIAPAALLDYLVLGYVLTPRTILAGVDRVPPATLLVYEEGALRLWRYWDLAAAFRERGSSAPEQHLQEELGERLRAATRLRLVADVPVGVLLSGGLDSSAVTAEATACLGGPIEAFTVSFPEPTYDELPAARAVARHLACPLHHATVPVTADAIESTLGTVLDEPLADTSLVPLYWLARLARERVTVVLSGDGADEPFGGYDTYLADRLFRWYRRLPGAVRGVLSAAAGRIPVTGRKVGTGYKVRQFLTVPDGDVDRAHWWWRVVFPSTVARRILAPDLRPLVAEHDPFQTFAARAAEIPDADPLARAQYVDVKTFLADGILAKVDRATMAHALEARSPFLDVRLVEFAASLPPRLKIRGLTKKAILRRLLRERLPAATLRAPKRGFNAPVSSWLRGPLREMAGDLLAPAALRETGLFEGAAVGAVWTAHDRGWHDQGFRLWALVAFMAWWEAVMRRPAGNTGRESSPEARRPRVVPC